MDQLKTLLEDIAVAEKRAGAEIPQNNGTTMGGHLSRRRAAELRIPELKREYRNELAKHILPIIVTGPLASDFTALASDKVGAVSVDGEALYAELLSRMPREATIGRMTTKVIADILTRHFMDVANEADVVSYPSLALNSRKSFAVKNKDDLDRLIKSIVNSSAGSEFSLIYNLNSIRDKALDMEFSSAVLPVLVRVGDETLVDSMLSSYKSFSGQVYLLTAGSTSSSLNEKALVALDSVDEESVTAALKEVKAALKNNKGANK
jgi:signal recognition particle subunit SEC65